MAGSDPKRTKSVRAVWTCLYPNSDAGTKITIVGRATIYGVLVTAPRDTFARGATRIRELIPVAVAQVHCDPIVRDRFIDAPLKIAIPHPKKIIALKNAARRNPVTYKNAEDLAGNVVVGRVVNHKSLLSNKFDNIRSGLSYR